MNERVGRWLSYNLLEWRWCGVACVRESDRRRPSGCVRGAVLRSYWNCRPTTSFPFWVFWTRLHSLNGKNDKMTTKWKMINKKESKQWRLFYFNCPPPAALDDFKNQNLNVNRVKAQQLIPLFGQWWHAGITCNNNNCCSAVKGQLIENAPHLSGVCVVAVCLMGG